MDVDTLICSEWALAEIGGQPVVDRVQSTLRFQSADRIIGWGVCNRYFEGLRSQEDIIEIGPIGSTRRVCPPVAMYQEVRFF